MPNIKSAKKRVIISEKKNEINSAKKSHVKNTIKKFDAAIAANDVKLAEELLKECMSVIDCAQKDGIYKKNTASRKKATLSKQLYAIKG